MLIKQKKEKMFYGIVGLGRFGSALATELAECGAELLVLDRDEDKISEFRSITENAMVIKNIDRKSLEETGIQNCDVAVVCIGEELDTSILATLHLVGMGIPVVISKAKSAEHGEILEKLGAQVVYPEKDMAIRLANRLEAEKVLDYIQLSEKINISKMLVPSCMVGKSVLDIGLRKKFGLNIIAIENSGNVTENVLPDYCFRNGDILFVSGSRDGMLKMSEWADRNR
ncbi:MAG: potassium channel family protein [Eubacteriales bacterium]